MKHLDSVFQSGIAQQVSQKQIPMREPRDGKNESKHTIDLVAKQDTFEKY